MSLTKVTYSMISGAEVNILDFGADPTGVADSTSAIQAAITSLGVNGGRVRFPGGSSIYRVTATITAPATIWNPVILEGDGNTKINATHNGVLFQGLPSDAFRMSNLFLNGPGKANTSSIGFSGNITQGTLENITVQNFYTGIYLPDPVGGRIIRPNISLCGNGIMIRGTYPNLVLIENGYIHFNDVGVNFENVYNLLIQNTAFEYNVIAGSLVRCIQSNLSDCWTEANSTASFQFTDSNIVMDNHHYVDSAPTYSYSGGWGFLPKTIVQLDNGSIASADYIVTIHNGTNGFTRIGGTSSSVPNYGFALVGQAAGNDVPFRGLAGINAGAAAVNRVVGVMGVGAAASDAGYVKQYLWNMNKQVGTAQHASLSLGYANGSEGTNDVPLALTANILNIYATWFAPAVDNAISLGLAGQRWSVVYAATGTINTSDANQKQDVESINDAEKATALAIKGLIKKFKFKDSVKEKGDKARIHFGVIAQEVQAAFTANGLDAENYGLFCSDTWYTLDDEIVSKGTEGATEVTQLGIRYDELLCFVIAAL
jgi:hypothetical protein